MASGADDVGIAFRHGPPAVHMVGNDDPAVAVKGRAASHLPDRIPRCVDLETDCGDSPA